jgi:hypothetical protein
MISDSCMIRGAAIFILTVPPIDELPPLIQTVAQRMRNETVTKEFALAYLTETQEDFIKEWIELNRILNNITDKFENALD